MKDLTCFFFFVSPISSFLTPDRLEKLNSIGFVWSVRGETIDEMDAEGHGLDHVFANLTGHDPVTGAKLVGDEDVPDRDSQFSEDVDGDEELNEETMENEDETTEETDA